MRKQINRGKMDVFFLVSLLITAPVCGYLILPHEEEQYTMLIRDGQYSDAVDELQKLVDYGDQRPVVLVSLAKAYVGTNRLGRAIDLMIEYVNKFSDDPEGFQLLSELYAKSNMPEEMTNALAKKFAIYPNKDDFLHLAALYKSLGRYDDERKLLQVSFKNTNFLQEQHLLRLGELLAASGDYQAAIQPLDQLDRNLPPELDVGRILLFDLMMQQNMIEKAISRAERWILNWRKPWAGIRILNRLALSRIADRELECFARRLAEIHPDMRSPIAQALIQSGHKSVARLFLDVMDLKRRFARSKIPDYHVSLALLEASKILDDDTLLWWIFEKSLRKPEAFATQALFADAIWTRQGNDAITPFLERISNNVFPFNSFLLARLSLLYKNRNLANNILADVVSGEISPLKKAALLQMKTQALE